MARTKKHPKAVVEEQEALTFIQGLRPKDDLYNPNDTYTNVEPGNADTDAEVEHQERLDSNDDMIEVNITGRAFMWIGFAKKNDQKYLRSEIAELKDMKGLTERDIYDLERSYAKHPLKAGGVVFGLQCTKTIKLLMHWVQDFIRVNKVLTFDDFDKGFISDVHRSGSPEGFDLSQ